MIDKATARKLMQAYIDEGGWPERDLSERYGITSRHYQFVEETDKSWIFGYMGSKVGPIFGIVPDVVVDKKSGYARISYDSADWRSPCHSRKKSWWQRFLCRRYRRKHNF